MTAERRPTTRHSIGVAVRRTGLKPDVIRAWEKRYGAIRPGRTSTNRRFYTDEQLDRLMLLRQATLGGRQIGQVAGLSTEQLGELVETDRVASGQVPQPLQEVVSGISDRRLSACLTSVEKLDPHELRFHLERAATDLTQPRLLADLLVPLLGKMGKLWESGAIRVVHEHVASAVIRAFLGALQNAFVGTDNAPSIVIGTPLRQEHELGALMASYGGQYNRAWALTRNPRIMLGPFRELH